MICPQCQGRRMLADYEYDDKPYNHHLCPYCFGEGNVHCCEGDQEQPEAKDSAVDSKE